MWHVWVFFFRCVYHCLSNSINTVLMENQVQDRLSSCRWLMTFAARSVPWSPWWRPFRNEALAWLNLTPAIGTCLHLVFFLQLIASIPKASAEVPYKSCSFQTHQGPLQPRQHRNCTELLKVERGWESWNLLHLRPKQHGYDKASFAILLSVLKWFESMTHMCHWNALESRKPQGIMTTALEYIICVSVRVEALSPSLALQPLEASKKNPAMCLCWTGVGQGMARGSVWSVWTSVD